MAAWDTYDEIYEHENEYEFDISKETYERLKSKLESLQDTIRNEDQYDCNSSENGSQQEALDKHDYTESDNGSQWDEDPDGPSYDELYDTVQHLKSLLQAINGHQSKDDPNGSLWEEPQYEYGFDSEHDPKFIEEEGYTSYMPTHNEQTYRDDNYDEVYYDNHNHVYPDSQDEDPDGLLYEKPLYDDGFDFDNDPDEYNPPMSESQQEVSNYDDYSQYEYGSDQSEDHNNPEYRTLLATYENLKTELENLREFNRNDDSFECNSSECKPQQEAQHEFDYAKSNNGSGWREDPNGPSYEELLTLKQILKSELENHQSINVNPHSVTDKPEIENLRATNSVPLEPNLNNLVDLSEDPEVSSGLSVSNKRVWSFDSPPEPDLISFESFTTINKVTVPLPKTKVFSPTTTFGQNTFETNKSSGNSVSILRQKEEMIPVSSYGMRFKENDRVLEPNVSLLNRDTSNVKFEQENSLTFRSNKNQTLDRIHVLSSLPPMIEANTSSNSQEESKPVNYSRTFSDSLPLGQRKNQTDSNQDNKITSHEKDSTEFAPPLKCEIKIETKNAQKSNKISPKNMREEVLPESNSCVPTESQSGNSNKAIPELLPLDRRKIPIQMNSDQLSEEKSRPVNSVQPNLPVKRKDVSLKTHKSPFKNIKELEDIFKQSSTDKGSPNIEVKSTPECSSKGNPDLTVAKENPALHSTPENNSVHPLPKAIHTDESENPKENTMKVEKKPNTNPEVSLNTKQIDDMKGPEKLRNSPKSKRKKKNLIARAKKLAEEIQHNPKRIAGVLAIESKDPLWVTSVLKELRRLGVDTKSLLSNLTPEDNVPKDTTNAPKKGKNE